MGLGNDKADKRGSMLVILAMAPLQTLSTAWDHMGCIWERAELCPGTKMIMCFLRLYFFSTEWHWLLGSLAES